MIRAILFDMGGTLDGDGQHWLERFVALYRDFGVDLPRETLREAFDEAERRPAEDDEIMSADFRRMIQLYVQRQLAHLALSNPALEQHLVEGFSTPVRKAVADNVRLLGELARRGFELGVVSNGCGNVKTLCDDFGYTPFLSVIVDSRRVGISKPDPGIFALAAEQLDHDPGTILMVGDSFERDIVPAKKIGMKTAWLEGAQPRSCPDPSMVDLRLQRLAELPGLLSPLSAAVR
jgi:HAD superfamily hydrolase (TIGR01549 family)